MLWQYRFTCCACILTILTVMLGRARLADAAGPLKRWAVLPAAELQPSGIGDLVQLELSKLPNWEMLERAEYDAIVSEANLMQLASSQSAAGLSELGQRLTADGLILLLPVKLENDAQKLNVELAEEKRTSDGKKPTEDAASRRGFAGRVRSKPPAESWNGVSLVICDSRTGARLGQQTFAFDRNKVEPMAVEIVAATVGVRERFPQGVERLFGVSTFESNNLIYKYDYLQNALRRLVESQLAGRAGVACVEFEEASRLLGEVEASDAGRVERTLPIALLGDFRVDDASQTVRLAVTLRSKDGSREIKTEDLPLADLSQWARDLAARVAGEALAVKGGLSDQQQIAWMLKKAAHFRALGDWRFAIEQYEAALLVDPANLEVRKNLLPALSNIITTYTPLLHDDQVPDRFQEKINAYIKSVRHIVFIFDQERERQTAILRLKGLSTPRHRSNSRRVAEPSLELLKLAESECRSAMLHISGLESKDGISINEPWLIQRSLSRIDNQPCSPADLKMAYRYWMNCPDAGGPPISLVGLRRSFFARGRADSGERDRKAWNSFVRALVQSDNENARVSAQLFLLIEQARELERGKEIDEDKLNYLKAVGRTLAYHFDVQSLKVDRRAYAHGLREFNWMLYRLDQQPKLTSRRRSLSDVRRKRPVEPRTKPPKPATARPQSIGSVAARTPRKPVREFTSGRITLELIPSPLPNRSRRKELKLINCGGHFDVFHLLGRIWLMREPGELEDFTHVTENELKVTDIVWHKDRLWVATSNDGIWGYDKSVQPVCHISEKNGLPPADGTLLLAFRDNHMYACGCFGSPNRSWIAELLNYDDNASIDLLYEARKVVGDGRRFMKPEAGYAFSPSLFCAGPELPPFKDRVGHPSVWVSASNSKILLDLSDRSVSIKPGGRRRYPAFVDSRSNYLCFENEIYSTRDVRRFQLVRGKKPPTQRRSRTHPSRAVEEGVQGFITIDGNHYLPGREHWLRVDVESEEVECLTDDSLSFLANSVFASSANYGILGWSMEDWGRHSYRVSISDSPGEQPAGNFARKNPQRVRVPDERPARPPVPGLSDETLPEISKPLLEANIQIARKFAATLGELPDGAILAYGDLGTVISHWLQELKGGLWFDPPRMRRDHCLYFKDDRLVRCDAFVENDYHYPPQRKCVMEIRYDELDRPAYSYNPRYNQGAHQVVTFDSKNRIRAFTRLDADFECKEMMVYGMDARGQTVTAKYNAKNGEWSSPTLVTRNPYGRIEKSSDRLEAYGFKPLLPRIQR